MKASEHLAGVLSDYALEAFDVIGMERDAELAGSPEELRVLLEARGWPVYQAALDFDAAVGGITLGGTRPLGVSAALSRRARERVPRDDELLQFEGKTLLPAAGSEITDLWIDEEGTIYRGYFGDFSGDDDGDYASPQFASYVTLLERSALQTETDWLPALALPASRPRYRADIFARVGADFAAALELPPWPPATDRFATVWRAGERLVIERPYVEMQWSETHARCAHLDEVVALWEVAARVATEATISWAGPAPEAPRPGDEILRRYSFKYSGRGLREVVVYGEPGQLRVAGW